MRDDINSTKKDKKIKVQTEWRQTVENKKTVKIPISFLFLQLLEDRHFWKKCKQRL